MEHYHKLSHTAFDIKYHLVWIMQSIPCSPCPITGFASTDVGFRPFVQESFIHNCNIFFSIVSHLATLKRSNLKLLTESYVMRIWRGQQWMHCLSIREFRKHSGVLNMPLNMFPKKSAFPPLRLLTIAAMVPDTWHKRLVDMNARPLTDEFASWS